MEEQKDFQMLRLRRSLRSLMIMGMEKYSLMNFAIWWTSWMKIWGSHKLSRSLLNKKDWLYRLPRQIWYGKILYSFSLLLHNCLRLGCKEVRLINLTLDRSFRFEYKGLLRKVIMSFLLMSRVQCLKMRNKRRNWTLNRPNW